MSINEILDILTEKQMKTDIDNLLMFTVKQHMNIICGFCGGPGHLPNECPLKTKLDTQFKNMGLKSEWGSVKGIIVD